LRKSGAKHGAMQVRQTEDGLHLTDSILWFDSRGSGDLSFLSSAASREHPKVPQVIATEETVKILEAYRKKPNALVCQYNRPFSIGRLKMELLPSGCVLGGASLYVETDKGRLLYAPQLLPQRVPTVRQMQLKRANTLILGVTHPDPHAAMPNRKKEKERLLETVRQYVAAGEYPVILCEPVATAQEITKLMTESGVPLAVHDAIFRVNTVYEAYGSPLGEYSRYSRKHTKRKVALFPLPRAGSGTLRAPLPDGPILVVEDTLEAMTQPGAAFRTIAARFHIASTCDGPEIREIIAAVNPRELYVFGPYAKRYVDELSDVCSVVRPLFPNDQPTLF
jgi:putative mRNA 3-end processing factor